jgi:hypothetical protein
MGKNNGNTNTTLLVLILIIIVGFVVWYTTAHNKPVEKNPGVEIDLGGGTSQE